MAYRGWVGLVGWRAVVSKMTLNGPVGCRQRFVTIVVLPMVGG